MREYYTINKNSFRITDAHRNVKICFIVFKHYFNVSYYKTFCCLRYEVCVFATQYIFNIWLYNGFFRVSNIRQVEKTRLLTINLNIK